FCTPLRLLPGCRLRPCFPCVVSLEFLAASAKVIAKPVLRCHPVYRLPICGKERKAGTKLPTLRCSARSREVRPLEGGFPCNAERLPERRPFHHRPGKRPPQVGRNSAPASPILNYALAKRLDTPWLAVGDPLIIL